MKFFVFLILAVFASEKEENDAENGPKYGERIGNNEENPILVKIEEDEYVKVNKKSKYIGVNCNKVKLKWSVQRWSKSEKKRFCNGIYKDEETAAHASDTLARKLMENGKQKLKLNFPDDYTEVYPNEKTTASKYIGLSYNKNKSSKWCAQRWSRNENTNVYNGCYDDEETAAHASDTLARKLMENGEGAHKLNFPDDYTEVYTEEKKGTSKYIGVSYNKNESKWKVQRRGKYENKQFYNGHYGDEETAAHASDTLARKLMENGEQLKLNFPDDYTEVYTEIKKGTSKYIGVNYNKINLNWYVQRWSKDENKVIGHGCYEDEETAAHASDTLARKLMENGEQKLKLNFPADYTEVHPEENRNKKRIRSKYLNLGHPQNK